MEENNNRSSINPFIAFLGVLLMLPLGASFAIQGMLELFRTGIVIEKLISIIIIYILGIIPLEASFLLLKLIFINKGKRIIFKDSPKFSYFVRYYLSLLPVFIIFMLFSSLFIFSLLRDFVRGNVQNDLTSQIWLFLFIIIFWKIFTFGFLAMANFTKIFIKKLRENKNSHSSLNK